MAAIGFGSWADHNATGFSVARLYPLLFGTSFARTRWIFSVLGIPGNPIGLRVQGYTPF